MGEKCYKGFENGLVCRGKQYAENKVFKEEKAEICNSGMHYCKNPFDVLDYYGFLGGNAEFNEFAEVEPMAEENTDDNKKFCTTKLKIGAKLSFSGFVKACVDFMIEKTKMDMQDTGFTYSSGYYAQIGSSGNSAKIYSTGEYSVICCAGNDSMAKAKKGSWITLAEWTRSKENGIYIPLCVKTEQVDGERIKEDTWYKLVNGEFKEIK